MGKTISVIGGDLRQATLARLLKEDGYQVKTTGFEKDIEFHEKYGVKSLREALDADILVLPLPVSYDNEVVNAQFAEEEIYLKDILENMNPDSIILGGKISEYIRGEIEVYGISYDDYFRREEMQVENAIPTVFMILS